MAKEFHNYFEEGNYRPEDLMAAYRCIQQAAGKLMADRQAKYGSTNISAFGLLGVLVRSTDKLARLRTMVQNDADDAEESIADSLCDLLNYATIGLMIHLQQGDKNLWDLPFITEGEANLKKAAKNDSPTVSGIQVVGGTKPVREFFAQTSEEYWKAYDARNSKTDTCDSC